MIGTENLAIGVSLFMRDTFTSQAQRAGTAMQGLKANADGLARSNAVLARNTAAMGAAIGVGMLGGITSMYKGAAKYDYLMKYVETLSDKSATHMNEIREKSNEVANATMFDPGQVADGMKYMAQAGMDYKAIMASTMAAATLGHATMSDLGGEGGAANWITSMQKGWNLPETEANFKHMADILAMSVNKSKTSLGDFGTSMTYVQATANRLNMGVEETAASLMIMANMGLKGSMGGVSINNMLTYATRAAGSAEGKKQANALHKMGLSQKDLQDTAGGLIPIGEMLEKIHKGTSRMGSIDAQNAIFDVFGMRGQKAIAITDRMNEYHDLLNELKHASDGNGYAAKTSDTMMNTPEGQLDMLNDNWIVFKNNFGTALIPLINPMVKGLIVVLDIIGKITNSPIGRVLAPVISGFIFLKTLTMAYNAVTLTIGLMQTRIGAQGVISSNLQVAGTRRQILANEALAASLLQVAAAQNATTTSLWGIRTNAGRLRGPDGRFLPAQMGVIGAAGMAGINGGWRGRLAGGINAASGMIGKYGMPLAMVGSMAASYGSDALGGNKTKAGLGVGAFGDALNGAMMGGMIGSVVPVIGTTVGAVVGGLAGLGLGIKGRLDEYNDALKDGNQSIKNTDHKINLQRLKADLGMVKGMRPGHTYGADLGPGLDKFNHYAGGRMQNGMPWDVKSSTIVINIDGKQAMEEEIQRDNLKKIINLGFR